MKTSMKSLLAFGAGFLLAAAAAAILLAHGAGPWASPGGPAPAADEDHHEGEPHGQADHDDHGDDGAEEHGHGHGAESSPLDRPLDELLAERCEHDRATAGCGDCRYEVGFVRVSPELLEDGLIGVAAVAERSFSGAVRTTGELHFDEGRIAHVTPRLSGIVRAVHATLGQKLSAGDLLFELDSTDLADGQSTYLQARAALRQAHQALRRVRALREKGIAAERELLAARGEKEMAQARVHAARDRILRLGVTPEGLERLASAEAGAADGRLVVRTPLAGSVLRMHLVPGEVVGPDESVMLVGDVGQLWMWADVYERDLAAVRNALARGALPATVRVAAFPDEAFGGSADLLDAVMEESTRTVRLRVTLGNPGGRLRPGMFAEAVLHLPGEDARLSFPAAALLTDEGRDFVFVRQSATDFVQRPVVVGRRLGDHLEVRAGLEAGQEVVSRGAFLLKSDVLREKMGAGCAD